MRKMRFLFAKEGQASYLSHLDVMRTFSRSFNRAGIPLRHTEGFNPHPYLSIAHPLSVGFTGNQEVLDCITLLEDATDMSSQLNNFLPSGLRVVCEADSERDIKDIVYAHYTLTLFYDITTPSEALARLSSFFSGSDIPVMKKSKKGMVQINLADSIAQTGFEQFEEGILLSVLIKANPAPLSPKYLIESISDEELKPDFVRYHRNGFLDVDKMPFVLID